MGTGLKVAGMGWRWKENSRAGLGRNCVYAGRVRVEVVTPRGRIGSNDDPASLFTHSSGV